MVLGYSISYLLSQFTAHQLVHKAYEEATSYVYEIAGDFNDINKNKDIKGVAHSLREFFDLPLFQDALDFLNIVIIAPVVNFVSQLITWALNFITYLFKLLLKALTSLAFGLFGLPSPLGY